VKRLTQLTALACLAAAALPAVADAGTPRCRGKKATIVGTNHDDRIRGTNKKDVIVALGGDDRVDGCAATAGCSTSSRAGTAGTGCPGAAGPTCCWAARGRTS